MKINPTQYTSFKQYVDDMPFGLFVWISLRADISQMTLQRIYYGKNKPTKTTVNKICSVTGLDPSVFDVAKEND